MLKALSNSSSECGSNGYNPQYSCDPPIEALLLGLVSLLLTIINILCIILTGILILKLKEVTPEKIPQNFSHFWKEDIKTHRAYQRAIRKGEDSDELPQQQLLPSQDPGQEPALAGTFLQQLFDRAATDQDVLDIRQWNSGGAGGRARSRTRSSSRRFRPTTQPSLAMDFQVKFLCILYQQTELPSGKNYRRQAWFGTDCVRQEFLQLELERSRAVRSQLWTNTLY